MSRPKEEVIDRDLLLDSFLEDGEIEFNAAIDKPIPILEWVEHLDLGGRKFSLEDHPYQRDMLTEQAQRQCFKKGSQVGITEVYNGPQNLDSVISYTWKIKGGGPSGTNAKEVSAFI